MEQTRHRRQTRSNNRTRSNKPYDKPNKKYPDNNLSMLPRTIYNNKDIQAY